LTTAELRARVEAATGVLLPGDAWSRLLDELEQSGHIEQSDAGWRLTASAERKFGRVLRDLDLGYDLDAAA
jgi:hypothetical protein